MKNKKQSKSFSSAFKRISNVKEYILIENKKRAKELKRPGVIQISGEVNSPEAVEGLRKLEEHSFGKA